MNQKRIVIVSHLFPPLFSGAAKISKDLAVHLADVGYEVKIITSHKRGLKFFEDLGYAKIFRYPFLNLTFYKSHFLNFIVNFVLAQIYGLLYIKSANILHIIGGNGLIYLPPGKMLNKNVIYEATLHRADDIAGFRRHGILGKIEINMLTKCNRLIAISSVIKNDFISNGIDGNKITGIPNFVDTEKHKPANDEEKFELREKLGLGKAEFVAVTAGAVEERKGISELIDIWEKVSTRLNNAKLIVVGPLPKENETNYDYLLHVRNKIKEYGLEKDAIFTGEVPSIENYLKASDLFLFCSKMEGFGTVQAEALACGLPVVCTDIPGISSDIVLDGETGWIIEPGDSDLFAAKVLEYFNDPDLLKSAGAKARQRAVELFSSERVFELYEQCYESLNS